MSGGGSGGGFRVSIPSSVRKTIQNIKEITGNHGDEEIYAMLKECGMDPNETAQKLLHQGTGFCSLYLSRLISIAVFFNLLLWSMDVLAFFFLLFWFRFFFLTLMMRLVLVFLSYGMKNWDKLDLIEKSVSGLAKCVISLGYEVTEE